VDEGKEPSVRKRTTAALTVASVCIAVSACAGGSDNGKPSTTTRPTSTSPKPVPLLDTALPGLLLSVDEINGVMGSDAMSVASTRFGMSDDSGTMEPPECLAVDGSAQATVYADTGFSAEREQTLQDGADPAGGANFTHYAKQAVILFPSAKQAAAVVNAAAQQWPACHDYTHLQSGSLWSASPVSNVNGMVSVTAAQQNANAPGWACGRALTARNNVVIDINTCSANPADTAVTIANKIAAKVAP
jgi:hypothetical protein